MERKCNYTQKDFLRYIQNKMSRKEETDFQYHLLYCPACEEKLATIRLVLSSLETNTRNMKRWLITVAVACSIGGGIYFSARHFFAPEQRFPLQNNRMKNYNSTDSILRKDTLQKDSTEYQITDFKIFNEDD